MATLLKSEAAFEERARECGLPSEELERLKAAGIKTISLLAFSTCAPGAQPSEDQLRALLRPLAPESLGVGVVAAIRHLMFECQTLCLAHVKASVEGSELAPAERTTRILNQKAKMQGLTLVGQLECSYASYDYVGAMLEKDSPLYLEPHRFDTRAAEVARERPGKELILDHNRISVRDKADKCKCAIQDPLALSQALQRRSLACDLMGACSYEAMHAWHSFLLDRMQQQAPPGWSRPTIEQVLRTDRAAWVRMSEQVKTLRRDSSGNVPLDDALGRLLSDPHVLFHLLPLIKPLKPSLMSPIGLPRSRTAILIGNASPMRPTSKPLATKLRRRNSRRSSRTSLACAWRLRRARSFAGHTTARKGVSLPRQESPAGVVSMLACAVVRIIPCKTAKSDK